MKVRIVLDTVVAGTLLNASTQYDGELVEFNIEDGGHMSPLAYKAAAVEAFKEAIYVQFPED